MLDPEMAAIGMIWPSWPLRTLPGAMDAPAGALSAGSSFRLYTKPNEEGSGARSSAPDPSLAFSYSLEYPYPFTMASSLCFPLHSGQL